MDCNVCGEVMELVGIVGDCKVYQCDHNGEVWEQKEQLEIDELEEQARCEFLDDLAEHQIENDQLERKK